MISEQKLEFTEGMSFVAGIFISMSFLISS